MRSYGADLVILEEVRSQAAMIRGLRPGDPEAAFYHEARLYRQVLQHIATGSTRFLGNALFAEMAEAALEAEG